MTINPGFGFGVLLFGMKPSDVEQLIGKPDRQFQDDEQNIITLYNTYKLRLTFYEDEDYRLGYAICSHQDALLHGMHMIGKPAEQLVRELEAKGMKNWEREYIDSAEHILDTDHWVTLVSEFGEVGKIEFGALIERDEFVWRFPEKAKKSK
jgi:hypothetical protein